MIRFTMVGKLVAHPGRRDELVELLMAGIRELKRADSRDVYVIRQENDNLHTIWVVEAWRDRVKLEQGFLECLDDDAPPLSPCSPGARIVVGR
jgi:quinol monooxygenase YgiN